jgi:thymidylate synthase (FAD)
MRTEVLDHGYVELVESWGGDERIIEAARMSTAKGFQGWGGPCKACFSHGLFDADMTYRTPNSEAAAKHCHFCKGAGKIAGDEKLLRYLWEHKHHTPFEMAGLTVEVQAPIFVFREWHRHRTQSYNELSARYTPLPDLFYVPSLERVMASKQSLVNKQGSEAGFTEKEASRIRSRIETTLKASRKAYEELLEDGVSREVARVVIPVTQYSRMRASANLRNWLAFLALRLPKNAQWEIRQFAEALKTIVGAQFPRTMELFTEGMER